MSPCYLIRSGLYLGSLTSLRLTVQYGISHVLSIMKEAPTVKEINPAAKCEQLCIPVDDTDADDLLSWFEQAIDFIQKGLAGDGKIIAAYLMMTEKLGHAEAICLVRRLKHDIQPNDGFQQQLQLWKEMGYKLDKSHAYFKERALRELSEQQLAGDLVEKEDLAIPEEAGSSQEMIYRCRKCRRLIATSANEAPMYLVVKQANEGVPQFAGKRMNGKETGDGKDTQLFVEPMQWMDEVVGGAVQGKLHCPGCQARLGSFNWAGMQNSKGAWVTPAFVLQLSKLDAMQPSAKVARLHRPPLS